MARKKRKSTGRRKSSRRRSRVGALPNGGIMDTAVNFGLGVPGGIFLSNFAANKITAQPLLKAGAQAVLGLGTAWLNKKFLGCSTLGNALAGGMIAGGGITLFQELLPAVAITDGAVAGLEAAAPVYSMSGLDNPAPTNSFIGAGRSESLRVRVR